MAYGADVNAKSNEGTALIFATIGGHTETVKVLLTYRADVNVTCNEVTDLMETAKMLGHEEIVGMLKQAAARE